MNDFNVTFKGIKRLTHTAMDRKPWAKLAFESDHLVDFDAFSDRFERELRWLTHECESRSIDVHVGGGVRAIPGTRPEGMEFQSPTDIEMIGEHEFDTEWMLSVVLRLNGQLNPSVKHPVSG